MAITNEQVIAFTAEQVRPLAELMRKTRYELAGLRDQYLSGINALVNAGSGDIEENRSDSKPNLSKTEVVAILARANEILAVLEASNAMDAPNKACVRPLRIS
ncbi:unnamed protein product [marine sediment metagenome]|uniref:Uncharacterized protein n=1 Tax=marine sediment metagenome TaxID=412755 RepID=X1W2P7_9ZZZZ